MDFKYEWLLVNGRGINNMFKKYKTVLVSGPTSSGKTTLLKRYIDYMQNEDDVNLIIIDPKQVELTEYKSKGKKITLDL